MQHFDLNFQNKIKKNKLKKNPLIHLRDYKTVAKVICFLSLKSCDKTNGSLKKHYSHSTAKNIDRNSNHTLLVITI